MSTRLSVTINAPAAGNDAPARAGERQQLAQILQEIAQKVGSGLKVSEASIVDHNGAAIGNWTYTPTASA